jgi:hypothetical protein
MSAQSGRSSLVPRGIRSSLNRPALRAAVFGNSARMASTSTGGVAEIHDGHLR